MGITKLTTNGVNGTKYDIASADNYYMEPIATNRLTSGTGTITFSNIPQNYKHLQLRMYGVSAATNRICIAYNSDTSTGNYNSHYIEGNGSVAYAGNVTGVAGNTYYTQSTTQPFSSIVDILDYSNVYKYKTQRALSGNDANGSGTVSLYSSLWMNTAAVTSLTITITSTTFNTNSRFSLYGIRG